MAYPIRGGEPLYGVTLGVFVTVSNGVRGRGPKSQKIALFEPKLLIPKENSMGVILPPQSAGIWYPIDSYRILTGHCFCPVNFLLAAK